MTGSRLDAAPTPSDTPSTPPIAAGLCRLFGTAGHQTTTAIQRGRRGRTPGRVIGRWGRALEATR